ncbi:metacaspase-1, partial [Tremellales sp. Uapishka_1]
MGDYYSSSGSDMSYARIQQIQQAIAYGGEDDSETDGSYETQRIPSRASEQGYSTEASRGMDTSDEAYYTTANEGLGESMYGNDQSFYQTLPAQPLYPAQGYTVDRDTLLPRILDIIIQEEFPNSDGCRYTSAAPEYNQSRYGVPGMMDPDCRASYQRGQFATHLDPCRGENAPRQDYQSDYGQQETYRDPSRQQQTYGPRVTDPSTGQVGQPYFEYSKCNGRRKALLIGINYIGTAHELKGCINDSRSVEQFICERYGYDLSDIVLLTDEAQDPRQIPTRDNIIRAMEWLVQDACKDDSLFFHYSGHGTNQADLDGDEDDGYDEGQTSSIEASQGLLGAGMAYFKGDTDGALKDLFGIAKSAYGENQAEEMTRRTKTSPADVIMWSGCEDSQTNADTQEAGKATGAMSFAFITALTKYPRQSYQQLLVTIREEMQGRYTQKPQLSACHPIDTSLEFVC